MNSSIRRGRILCALHLALVLPLLWSFCAQAALYQFTVSATGQTQVNGGPPSLPGTIAITGVADPANVQVGLPPVFPRPAVLDLPLDHLFFSGPGVSGEFVTPGKLHGEWLTPHSNGLSVGGTGVGGDPGIPLWDLFGANPTPSRYTSFNGASSTGQTFLLTSGDTVAYSYGFSPFVNFSLEPVVPEPATIALWLGGLIVIRIASSRVRSA